MLVEDGSGASGYVTDLTYTESFFRELSPAWLGYVAALSGVGVGDLRAPFNYLELGCGRGQTALMNAAAFPDAQFHACDLNPQHISAARRAAADCAVANIEFHEIGFAELLELELPSFDFIVLHGVYSWVDSAARAALRTILASKLRPQGLAYISYNCLPGWAGEAPLRKLLIELAASESGDSGQRSASALQALVRLSGGKLQFLSANPSANTAVEKYQRDSLNYLVHEFMNRSWDLFYGVDVADELREIGLEYLGSATLADNHPMLQLDERTASMIAGLTTERQRHLAADFATNRRFRRDVFVRGNPARATDQVSQQLAATLLGCVRLRDLARATLRVPRGELTLQPDFMHELAVVMQQGPVSTAQVVTALHRPGRDPAGILRNLLFLVAGGTLQPCARATPAPSRGQALRYATPTVQLILQHCVEHAVATIVPSAVLGNGMKLQPYEALCVAGIIAGHTTPAALSAWLDGEMPQRKLTPAPRQSSRELASYALDELLPTLLRFGILY